MLKAARYNRKTLNDLLFSAVASEPANGIGFVQPDGSILSTSYPALLSKAQSLAGSLQALGIMPQDKIMLVMTRNEDILLVIWACIMSGAVPTILQPPVSFTEFNQPARKIANVFDILDNPYVIISPDLIPNFHLDTIPGENLINSDDLGKGNNQYALYHPDENDLAFIQFSSGSTGDPKGIKLTHKNILTNLEAISVGLDIYDTDIMSNWMPLYHDMGLFGFHMTPVFAHSNHYLIDPVDFVKKPSLWLDVIDKAKSTITGCPNFGQALLLRYLKNRDSQQWDLSSLKAIVNGAEPISNRIMSEFIHKMAVYKLRPEAMMPAYGMAEATLAITFADLWKEPVVTTFNRALLQQEGKVKLELSHPSEGIELVSVGKCLNDIELRILDEDGGILGDEEEGHIQIRGQGITAGYYNNEEETRKSFDNGWLKTGDKGFFHNGELYITGRIKDIIFVRGQNLYAHDLENLAGKFMDISYGKIVISGWFDPQKGQDQVMLFLVGMLNQATCNTFIELKNFFRDNYGISIDVFIPLRSNQVPKTSSGKIQRHKLITSYQNGEFNETIADLRKMMAESEKLKAKS
jgi:acyl-CoA synthetase (AMP-forming)/AMP-acid ligase II